MGIHRRSILKTVSLAAGAATLPPLAGRSASSSEIRLGMIGTGVRGLYLCERALLHPGIKITAVCDIVAERANQARQMVKTAAGYEPAVYTRGPEDYRRLLERKDVDAVLILTPWNQHATQAVAAMRAGKHVGSETPPAWTIEECWELVETKEQTGRRYMLLENYPYTRSRLTVLNMAYQGAFGEITYGECSYIHDIRFLNFDTEKAGPWKYRNDGSLLFRGELVRDTRGDLYPTHGLGPMSLWMGINRGDRLTSLVSMDNETKSSQAYVRENFGKDHRAAKPGFFRMRDTTVSLIRTAGERVIALRNDMCSPRPAGGWAELQGTKGSYDDSPGGEVVYLEGRSPSHRWEPLSKYQVEFEHPFWKEEGQLANNAGHGGGDYFVLREFFNALAENREPPIDVYDAATWSAILPLSGESLNQGSTLVEIPDFTKGAWKNRTMSGFGLNQSS
ncbi:MAG: Gfo/Idh/MocA family oxidoreductase [Acidobacteriota bacterium]